MKLLRRSVLIPVFAALVLLAGYPSVLVAVAEVEVHGTVSAGGGLPDCPFARPVEPPLGRTAFRARREPLGVAHRTMAVVNGEGQLAPPSGKRAAPLALPDPSVSDLSSLVSAPRGPPTT